MNTKINKRIGKVKAILIGLIGILPMLIVAQEIPKVLLEKIPVQLLHEDLDILQENLQSVHPGLYAYHSKEEFEKFFIDLKHQIDLPLTALEFYRSLLPLHPVIGNGHTSINRPQSLIQGFGSHVIFLPIDTYMDRDTLFITRNMSEQSALIPGTAILKINDQHSSKLFEQMQTMMTRDGINETMPFNSINANFGGWYCRIIDTPDTYKLEVVLPSGKLEEFTVQGMKFNEIKRIRKERFGPRPSSFWQNDDPALKLEIKEDVAVMTIKVFAASFVKKEKNQKFDEFYEAAFKEIKDKNVKHLIIDLRNNGGGDPKPTIGLISHLLDHEFTFYKDVTAWTKKVPNKELYGDDTYWSRKSNQLAIKKAGNTYKIKDKWWTRALGFAGLKPSKPAEDVYKEKVYVLIDGNSFSATGETAALIKEHDRAIFIGKETGGNPNQNTSGIQLMMTLPHSKTRIIIPFWLWETNVTFENTGRGVIPDYELRDSIEDELNGVDAVMEFTMELIGAAQ